MSYQGKRNYLFEESLEKASALVETDQADEKSFGNARLWQPVKLRRPVAVVEAAQRSSDRPSVHKPRPYDPVLESVRSLPPGDRETQADAGKAGHAWHLPEGQTGTLMRDFLEDHLFSHGFLVSSGDANEEEAPYVEATLATLFGIRLASNAHLADLRMVETCARNLGQNVPEPFYRGFPESVLELTTDELLLDQMLHYIRTYGMGDFSEPGHSLFEREIERHALRGGGQLRAFEILEESEAVSELCREAQFLLEGTRPLSKEQLRFVAVVTKGLGLKVTRCASRDTSARLVLVTRDINLARLLRLSDVLRLVEWMAFYEYSQDSIDKLNLRNQDRRFICQIIDAIFAAGEVDIRTCLERRRQWVGLLHHLHVRPKTDKERDFVRIMREGKERSHLSKVEACLGSGDVRGAVSILAREKGSAAIVRNLLYLLSRSKTDEDIGYVLEGIRGCNRIVLIQILMMLSREQAKERRVFGYVRHGLYRSHTETKNEANRRRTRLGKDLRSRARKKVWEELRRCTKGTLDKVYVSDDMRLVALPLSEGASFAGVGAVPSGSRANIEGGTIVRAFVWWRRVNDIDLSCIGLDEEGRLLEFSWRTMSSQQSRLGAMLVYSGDETSGFKGGSEYFDVDTDAMQRCYPNLQYLVFCANVYTGTSFSTCECRAGYMLRDDASDGEVYEPSTVATSVTVDCMSTFAYLFAIDFKRAQIVWLNKGINGDVIVAGETGFDAIDTLLDACDIINMYDFASLLAREVVDDPCEADVVFSDDELDLRTDQEQIHSYDLERVTALLNSRMP